MPPKFTQANSPMRLTTPLGADALLLTGLTIREGLSQLFLMQLDAIAENDQDVPFEKLLGQKATVQMIMPGGKARFFNGIIARVGQGGRDSQFTTYRLELSPQFWLLTRKWQCRIFQQINVPDILKNVLTGIDAGFEIQGTFQPRDYCVQYRESDFNFASRLMEEEGIYYFFKHTQDGHKMVLANTPGSHPDVPEQIKVPFEDVLGGVRDEMRVTIWGKVQELRSGKYTLFDHHFELPHKHLEADKQIADSVQAGVVSHKLKLASNDKLEIFDFPGEYAQRFDGINPSGGDRKSDLDKIFDDNKRTVAIRMEQETVPGLVIQGSGTCRQFVSGHKFTLERHFNANGPYVLTGVTHVARQSQFFGGQGGPFEYSNTFTCIPFAQPYRPQRTSLKPIIQGTQSAVVVGPKGEEIFTDRHGRVKVQFHWDREGKNDANSSCWIRVAQPWAGRRWGAFFIPRIGQEIIVDFLEGDPDQPICVGCVYNPDQPHPYLGDSPDTNNRSNHKQDPKLSGVKSNTTPGGVGFNEWRFDDTKGKEQVFIHGERDMDLRVKNDRRELVLHDTHLIVGGEKDGKKVGDQREEIFQDRHQAVHRDHIEQVMGNVQYMVGHGDADDGGNVDVVIEKDKKELIEKNSHLHVKADQLTKVDGTQSLHVVKDRKEWIEGKATLEIDKDRTEAVGGVYGLTVAKDQNEDIQGSMSLKIATTQDVKVGTAYAFQAGTTVYIKAGAAMVLESGAQLSLKVGGNFIDIGPTGVAIQGTTVMINSGGAAGSGSGPNPVDPVGPELVDDPEDAKQAKPTKPDTADNALSGQKSVPN
jgi:type VI secretion system secreted protein VgrG